MKIAITGAFSYSGKYIDRRLLGRGDEVITLTGHPHRPDPFAGRVRAYALNFGDPPGLVQALRGAEVLVNTYWVRFDYKGNTQTQAVENTRTLIQAAGIAGVRRVVHISITNPAQDSPLPYFRGKALNEKIVMERAFPMLSCARRYCLGKKTFSSTTLLSCSGAFPSSLCLEMGTIVYSLSTLRRHYR
ncbi:MAG: SDR family oxidoreductase [Anaerolineales bacterium]